MVHSAAEATSSMATGTRGRLPPLGRGAECRGRVVPRRPPRAHASERSERAPAPKTKTGLPFQRNPVVLVWLLPLELVFYMTLQMYAIFLNYANQNAHSSGGGGIPLSERGVFSFCESKRVFSWSI